MAQRHPLLESDAYLRAMPPGETLSEIVAAAGLHAKFAYLLDLTGADGKPALVPAAMWAHVRPRAGTTVRIYPDVQGRQGLALVATIALAAAAGPIGAWGAGAMGFAAGTTAFKVATAAITATVSAVGALAINALIAPPQASGAGNVVETRYDVAGSANEATRYAPIPMVLGRHRLFPPKIALPWTESHGDQVYLRERLTFGWGPVALEDLRLGDTPIENFDDVEIELRNVDQAITQSLNPELAAAVTTWRCASQAMTLYPDDVSTEVFNIDLPQNVPADLTSAIDTRRATVDISFPEGLIYYTSRGNPRTSYATFSAYCRPAGTTDAWQLLETWTHAEQRRAALRFSRGWKMPDVGQWDIRIERRDQVDADDKQFFDRAYLVALRSFQSGGLPSDPDIAEIAIRVRASDQLNGPLDQLNAVVRQLAPVWNGTTWSAPQLVRHPVWLYAQALRGPHLRDPVPDARIDLAGLKAIADQHPDRTCDYVVRADQRLADVLDIIASACRAKRTMRDFRHTMVTDQAGDAVVQMFTPHNSFDFEGEIDFPPELHGLRVRVISERADWQQDEILVYADGYNASNATIFETLELPGIVVTADQANGGWAWRDGRYHLAQIKLRPERWSFSTDLEDLVCGLGSKIRLGHDVPRIGLGSGRVLGLRRVAGEVIELSLDDMPDIAEGDYLLRVRHSDGTISELPATMTAAPATAGATLDLAFADDVYAQSAHEFGPGLALNFAAGIYAARSVASSVPEFAGGQVWALSDPAPAALAAGDLVLVEDAVTGAMDAIITRIEPQGDLRARITCVPASPAVLDADTQAIPPYDPLVASPRNTVRPALPVIRRLFSGPSAAVVVEGGADLARIGVEIEPVSGVEAPVLYYRLRWREQGSSLWSVGETQAAAPVVYTGTLSRRVRYDVEVEAVGFDRRSSGWAAAGAYTAYVDVAAPGPVRDLRVDVLTEQARLSWARPEGANVDHYEVRHSTDPAADWGASVAVAETVRQTEVLLPAHNGVYHVRARNFDGLLSEVSATVQVNSGGALQKNVVQILTGHPAWNGTTSGSAYKNGAVIEASAETNNVHDFADLHAVADMHTDGAVEADGYIELAETCDLGAVYTSRVSVSLRGGGSNPANDVHGWTDLHAVIDAHGASDDSWRITVEISTTEDTGPSPTWGPWQPVVVGDHKFAQARFRLRMEALDEAILVQVSELEITVDMPDRIERGADIAHVTGGTQITYPGAFRAMPALTIDGQNLPSGARILRSAVSAAGFTVNFTDSGGTNLTGVSFDYTAIGHGKEE